MFEIDQKYSEISESQIIKILSLKAHPMSKNQKIGIKQVILAPHGSSQFSDFNSLLKIEDVTSPKCVQLRVVKYVA